MSAVDYPVETGSHVRYRVIGQPTPGISRDQPGQGGGGRAAAFGAQGPVAIVAQRPAQGALAGAARRIRRHPRRVAPQARPRGAVGRHHERRHGSAPIPASSTESDRLLAGVAVAITILSKEPGPPQETLCVRC